MQQQKHCSQSLMVMTPLSQWTTNENNNLDGIHLEGYVRIVDSAVDIDDVTVPSVDTIVM